MLSLYTDRGSHYFHTEEAGGPVNRKRLTQVGNAAGQIRLTLRELVQRFSDDCEFALNRSGDHLVVCIGAGIKPCREPQDRAGRVLHVPQEGSGITTHK
jgi:hypothetical protein